MKGNFAEPRGLCRLIAGTGGIYLQDGKFTSSGSEPVQKLMVPQNLASSLSAMHILQHNTMDPNTCGVRGILSSACSSRAWPHLPHKLLS